MKFRPTIYPLNTIAFKTENPKNWDYSPHLYASENFHLCTTNDTHDHFYHGNKKPSYFTLCIEENSNIIQVMITPKEAEEIKFICRPIGTINNRNIWIETPGKLVYYGNRPETIENNVDYLILNEQIQFCNADLSYLLMNRDKLLWLPHQADEKINYLDHTVLSVQSSKRKYLPLFKEVFLKSSPCKNETLNVAQEAINVFEKLKKYFQEAKKETTSEAMDVQDVAAVQEYHYNPRYMTLEGIRAIGNQQELAAIKDGILGNAREPNDGQNPAYTEGQIIGGMGVHNSILRTQVLNKKPSCD